MAVDTVIVAIIGSLPLFTAMNEGRLPIPDAGKPIDGLEFVHFTAAPGVAIKLKTGKTVPSLTVVFVTVTDGMAFTSNINEDVSAHCPAVGVKMYVPVTWLLTADGLHIPETSLLDFAGKTGTVEPLQTDREAPKGKAGFTIGLTATVNENGEMHWPDVPVKTYTPFFILLITAGLHVPAILLLDVVGKTGAVAPAQSDKLFPKLKLGFETFVTVTVYVVIAEVTHCPAFGVNV